LSTLLLLLVLVRVLNPSDYGVYMTMWGLIELFVPISALGLLQAAQRFLPEIAQHGNVGNLRCFVRYVTIARLILVVSFCGVLYIQWESFSSWVGLDSHHQRSAQIALLVVISTISARFVAEMLESLLVQKYAQLVRALDPLLRLVGVLSFLLVENLTLTTVLLVDFFVSLSCFALGELLLHRQLRLIAPTGDRVVTASEVAVFAWHVAGWQLLSACGGIGVFRLIASKLFGFEVAGLFAFLQQLAVVLCRYLPGTLFANILRPMLVSRYAQGLHIEVARAFGLVLLLNLVVLAVVVSIFPYIGNELIEILSGGRFAEGGAIFLFMLLALVMSGQGSVLAMAMQIYGYTSTLRNFGLLVPILPVLVLLIGERMSVLDFAFAIAADQVARVLILYLWLSRQPAKTIIPPSSLVRLAATLVGSAISGHAILLCGLPPISAAVVALCAFLVGLLLSRPFDTHDLAFVSRASSGAARVFGKFVRP
jgi:O-antigen/teichoic acid export membrane protein